MKKHNILAHYIYNLSLLKLYKQKSGSGVFYFFLTTHPDINFLTDLNFLVVPFLLEKNGVKREFSQIANLLNKMKVISKKQLNQLQKK